MTKRKEELTVEPRSEIRGGNGVIPFTHLLSADEIGKAGRTYALMTIEPGCSIGEHDHQGEAEVYWVLDGDIHCTDDGAEEMLHAGDVMYTSSGHRHSIENLGDKTVNVLALIIKNV